MYNDFIDTSRERWKFTYTGEQLLPFAKSRQTQLHVREDELRTDLAEAMKNRDIPINSDQVRKMEKDLDVVATRSEQLDVFVHEFKRNPQREFSLSLSDVVFFGIVGKPAE